MFYDLDCNTNSYSSDFKSHTKDFILIKSDKSFGSVMALSVVDRYLGSILAWFVNYVSTYGYLVAHQNAYFTK